MASLKRVHRHAIGDARPAGLALVVLVRAGDVAAEPGDGAAGRGQGGRDVLDLELEAGGAHDEGVIDAGLGLGREGAVVHRGLHGAPWGPPGPLAPADDVALVLRGGLVEGQLEGPDGLALSDRAGTEVDGRGQDDDQGHERQDHVAGPQARSPWPWLQGSCRVSP